MVGSARLLNHYFRRKGVTLFPQSSPMTVWSSSPRPRFPNDPIPSSVEMALRAAALTIIRDWAS